MIRAAAAKRGIEVTIAFTEQQDHARELGKAAVAAQASGVVVWGGDGTFNETAGALLNSAIPVGLVPAGSGNGLAGALGVPRDPARAIAVALDGRLGAIDAGSMAGRYFFNIAGVGFDARVAALFNARGAGARGAWPYLMIGVREGCTYCALDYDVQLDGDGRKYKALLIAFANGTEYGLGARIAPGASLDDGLLDVIIVEDASLIARFWHARHLALGRPELAPPVTMRRVTRAVIEADGEMEFHVDGEPGLASRRIEVEILPGALLIRR
jgi:YegS/Rv2252/BmrU family lipid kinase